MLEAVRPDPQGGDLPKSASERGARALRRGLGALVAWLAIAALVVALPGVGPADAGNTSETSPATSIPGSKEGNGSNAGPSQPRIDAPPTPNRPPAYVSDKVECSWSGGTLFWGDDGAAEYYVRSVAADGTETYLGGRVGTSTAVPAADGYRVVSLARGYARSATCGGPGDPVGPGPFDCSYSGGTLSWSDLGASAYYVRLVDAAGADSYFGSSSRASLAVPQSASYLVIRWDGPNRIVATCGGN